MADNMVPIEEALETLGLQELPRGVDIKIIQLVDLEQVRQLAQVHKEYMTVPEAAKILGRFQSQLYQHYIPSGQLHSFKIGSRNFVMTTDVYSLKARLEGRSVPDLSSSAASTGLPQYTQYTKALWKAEDEDDYDNKNGQWIWPDGTPVQEVDRIRLKLPKRWGREVGIDDEPMFDPEDYE